MTLLVWPDSAGTTISSGQLITGGSLSLTLTSNEQFAEPALLIAVQVTPLVPSGKTDPEVTTVPAGAAPPTTLQVTVGVGLPVTVRENGTLAPHNPGELGITMAPGQAMVGSVLAGFTVTVKLHWDLLPALSVAVQFTGRSEEHTSELQSHSFISYAV